MLQFEWPWIFALIPLPLAVYWLLPQTNREDGALLVPFFKQLSGQLGSNRSSERARLGMLLPLLLVWLATVTAAARPQLSGDPVSLPASGRDLLLAVDISASMEATDMVLDGRWVDRLTAVKDVVGDFVQRRESDRLGLILFGTQAYLQAPLTFDRSTVNKLLQEARLNFAGERTAIGDAIGLAVKRLLKRPQSSRVLILLTDGANSAGNVEPNQAAKLAQASDVTIYTVGIGSRRGRDLDEGTLMEIAELTGGQYFRARNRDELEEIYALLDELEPQEQNPETYRPKAALFYWPLGAALIISALMALSVPLRRWL